MHELIGGQSPTFAILQPFLCGLVAAYVKVPGGFWDALKILRFVDMDIAGRVRSASRF